MTDATHKPTVLIVDDSPEGIDVLRNLLQPYYDVQAAIHGELALRMARRFTPDIILLDVMMPDMDGYEVCRRLKSEEATARIPVILSCTRDRTSRHLHRLPGHLGGRRGSATLPILTAAGPAKRGFGTPTACTHR